MKRIVLIGIFILFSAQYALAGSGENALDDVGSTDSLVITPSGSEVGHSVKKTKSTLLAAGFSAILPGMGEYYLGHKKKALFFAGIDLMLWAGYGYNAWFERNSIRDYHNFARTYAGVSSRSFDDSYWIQVGKYNDIYENNTAELINRRLDLVYNNVNDYYWQWQSLALREKYNNLRDDAHRYNRRKSAFVVGLLASRLVSIFNIIRISRQEEKKDKISLLNLKTISLGQGRQVMMFSFTRVF